jgi:AcrR family transcriptional regulator
MSQAKHTQPVRPYGGISAAERVAVRRTALLDAGLEMFGTVGYAQTRVKDLCRQAGLTDRYFYESFTGTDELFLAVFQRIIDELFAAVADAVAVAESGVEPRLRAGIGTFVHALAADQRKLRVVFTEAAGAGHGAEAHMRASLRRFTGLVAETARRGLTAPPPEPMPQVLALSLVGTLERLVVEWQDGELELSVDGIVEHAVALFRTVLAAAETGDLGAPSPDGARGRS